VVASDVEYKNAASEHFTGDSGKHTLQSFKKGNHLRARYALSQPRLTGEEFTRLLRSTDWGSCGEVLGLEDRMSIPAMGPIVLGFFSVGSPVQYQCTLRLLPSFSVIYGDEDNDLRDDNREPYLSDTILARFNATMQQGRRKQAISDETDEGYDEPEKVRKTFEPEVELRVFCQLGAVQRLKSAKGQDHWIDTNFVLVLSLTEGFRNPFFFYDWKKKDDPCDSESPILDMRDGKSERDICQGGKLVPYEKLNPFVYCRIFTTLEELLDPNKRPEITLHNRPQYCNYMLVSARKDPSGVPMRPDEYPEHAKAS